MATKLMPAIVKEGVRCPPVTNGQFQAAIIYVPLKKLDANKQILTTIRSRDPMLTSDQFSSDENVYLFEYRATAATFRNFDIS